MGAGGRPENSRFLRSLTGAEEKHADVVPELVDLRAQRLVLDLPQIVQTHALELGLALQGPDLRRVSIVVGLKLLPQLFLQHELCRSHAILQVCEQS